MSLVDKDYYDEVRNSVREDAKWHLGCHDDKARNDAEWSMNVLKVPAENWGRFAF